MHPGPLNRGVEIASDVADGPYSVILEQVANGVGCHHEQIPPTTPEGALISLADQLSGGRSGARHESLESYLRQGKRLESLALKEGGVKMAYAIDAARGNNSIQR